MYIYDHVVHYLCIGGFRILLFIGNLCCIVTVGMCMCWTVLLFCSCSLTFIFLNSLYDPTSTLWLCIDTTVALFLLSIGHIQADDMRPQLRDA